MFPSLTAVCVLVFTIPPFLRFFLIFPAFKLPRCSKYFMRSSVPAGLQDLQPTVFSRYLALCPLRVFPAPDLAADFLPDASDKKFTHKIRHRKIPGEHKNVLSESFCACSFCFPSFYFPEALYLEGETPNFFLNT